MTRDEFLDIMGEIDSELIERNLDIWDISRGKAVKLQYDRPTVWRNIAGIAACIAILVTVFAVGYFKSIPTQSGESPGAAYSESPVPEIIRGWDPEELVYSDAPVLGANVRVSVAELDGITAELILHNIKKEAGTALFAEYADSFHYEDKQAETGGDTVELPEPAKYDYTDYVGAEDIVLYVHDDKGRRFIETSVTPYSYNGMELIAAHCLFDDCTRLYNVEGNYVLMQYVVHISDPISADDIKLKLYPIYLARFYKLDLNQQRMRDENGIYTGGLISVKFDNGSYNCIWKYGYAVTREFEYVPSGYFYDSGYYDQDQTTYCNTFEGIKFFTTISDDIMLMLPSLDYQS